MHKTRLGYAALTLSIGGFLAFSLTAPASAMTQVDEGGYVETFIDGELVDSTIETAPAGGGGMSTKSLPLTSHAACYVLKDSTYVVAKFDAVKYKSGPNKLDMKCGKASGAGYLHIESRHKKDWVNKGKWHNAYPESEWDMFMMKAARQALVKPLHKNDEGDGKTCFQSSVTQTYYTAKGLTDKRTWDMSVVFSRNNALIITAFPGTSCKG